MLDPAAFEFRRFREDVDLPNIVRIWRECGWVRREEDEAFVTDFYAEGSAWVADHLGAAECVSLWVPGTMRYMEREVSLCAVTAVLTSRVARRRGGARQLTALAVAEAAEQGMAVASLGIFDQGFYDQLGFGGGAYEHVIAFDPNDLRVEGTSRVPVRLGIEDWEQVARAVGRRARNHGGCAVETARAVKAEMGWLDGGFGLGFRDDEGELSHFFYGTCEGEHAPLRIAAMIYQSGEQLLELFSLLRGLGDQVSQVSMVEPTHLQLQDLLHQPFRARRATRGSQFENHHRSCAFWQLRILDLAACLAQTELPGKPLRFNLRLHDPLPDQLPSGSVVWQGTAGEYLITLGPESSADRSTSAELPWLEASIGAFSRLWLGVRPASELALTDELSAPKTLLQQLDRTLRVPTPRWRLGFHD